MKKIIIYALSVLFIYALTGCEADKNATNCPTAGYSISPVSAALPADGRSTTGLTVTLAHGQINGDSTVELSITDGALIFNNGMPQNRLVLNYTQVSDPSKYLLQVRAGLSADSSVYIIMKNLCGVVYRQRLNFYQPTVPALFLKTRLMVLTDSTKSANAPFVKMYLSTSPLLANQQVQVSLSSSTGFNISNAIGNTLQIDTFGHSQPFTISYTGTNPNIPQTITFNLINSTGTYAIDTLMGFYNILSLLPGSGLSFTASSPSILSDGLTADTLTFHSGLTQLSGYPVTFTTSKGTLLFSAASSPTTISLNLDNTGSAVVYLRPDTSYVGNIYVRANYFGTAYYKDLLVNSVHP